MRRPWSLFSLQGQRKYLNWSEREAFFQAAQTCPDDLEKAFLLTLFYTGCRISEALECNGERVDFSEQAIIYRTLKRRDPNCYRIIPLPETHLKLLDDVVMRKENFAAKLWSFSRTTGYRLVKRYMSQAGITGIKACPKGLRHSYAIACITRNIPITTVQRWMGHARLETTAIYLNLIGEDERQQAAKLWKTY